jgi:DNA polymerase-3 subunit delta'
MQFKSIPGQKIVKQQLTNLVSQNRLSHALLFLGKEGSGALQMAMALAQFLVCDKTRQLLTGSGPSLFGEPEPVSFLPGDDSCGVCPACQKAAKLIHPDIHFSYPTITKPGLDKPVCTDFIQEWRSFISQLPFGNSYDWLQSLGAENKQGNITAHECEDINRKLNLKSFESGYKILIQWLPEYLGNSGNKLLKLVEEPPDKTLFIFVAEDESKILQTILSRTQLVKINRLKNEEVQEWLVTEQGVPKTKAATVAAMSNGNLREALQQLNHADQDWQEMLREWLNAMLKNGPAAQVQWVEQVSKLGREKQKQFIIYFIHLLSLAVRMNATTQMPEAGEQEVDFASRFIRLASNEQLEVLVQELNDSVYYIERNANPKILFMALTIKIYHIIRDKAVILVH